MQGQGLRDRTLVELLGTRYGVPQKLVDSQAEGRKGMHEKEKRLDGAPEHMLLACEVSSAHNLPKLCAPPRSLVD